MTQYEQILSKVSYVFYKFINYREYFNTNTGYEFSYLRNAGISSDSVYSLTEIPITKAPTYVLGIDRVGVRFSPTITLYKDYRIGKNIGVTHEEAIVDLILNKFTFEKHSVINSLAYRRPPDTYKDLIIAAVGKDTYDTIRANIK